MSRKLALLVAVSLLFAFPAGVADDGDGPDENATWGLCTADDANDDNESNGTVSETPAFNDTDEEDCEEAGHPSNASAPDDTPGADDNPGDEHREDPDEDDQGEDGSDEQPDDPGQDEGSGDDGSGDDGSDNRP